MATYGIYDFDFMNYQNVIPNLECAKLCAYYKRMKQIAVLAPNLEPERYTNFIIRKEYDDGVYPKELLLPNVTYGGRAFSGETYAPLNDRIEKITPDFSVYEKYINLFSTAKTQQELFRKILRSVHCRISPDEQEVRNVDFIKAQIQQKSSGIILHDYNLNKIKDLFEIIQEISNSRSTLKGTPKPLPVGNKFPLELYDQNELIKWSYVLPYNNLFFLKYNGLMDNEVLYELIERNPRFCRQIYYSIDEGCKDEKDFLDNRAIELFKQILYYKRTNTKILLKYKDGFFTTRQMKSLIYLWNCYGAKKWEDYFMPANQSLYGYVANKNQYDYTDVLKRKGIMNQDEAREVFKYVREHNYELFKMFYEWDAVSYKGGEFINDWTAN